MAINPLNMQIKTFYFETNNSYSIQSCHRNAVWQVRFNSLRRFHSTLGFAVAFYTLRPRQNGRHFADDTFKLIFLPENIKNSIKISLKFVSIGPINNIPALVQIMAWRRSGDKPLSEPVVVSLLTHIWVTRPQWVESEFCFFIHFLSRRKKVKLVVLRELVYGLEVT